MPKLASRNGPPLSHRFLVDENVNFARRFSQGTNIVGGEWLVMQNEEVPREHVRARQANWNGDTCGALQQIARGPRRVLSRPGDFPASHRTGKSFEAVESDLIFGSRTRFDQNLRRERRSRRDNDLATGTHVTANPSSEFV